LNSAVLMTFSNLQGHSLIANLFKCNFSYSCAAVDRTSADLEHRMVPVR